MDVKVKQLRLMNEMMQTQGNLRTTVLEILGELFAPQHPADQESALVTHGIIPVLKQSRQKKK